MAIPELKREFEIPEGVEAKLEGKSLTVSGPRGTLTTKFTDRNIEVYVHDDRVILLVNFPSTRTVALFGMYAARIRNMIGGVTRGFRSKLKVISSHFPITMGVREGEVLINNFLGERYPRKARIYDGVVVVVEGEFVIVSGMDKDGVAQTAANIEQATVIRKRDRRIFQDGIYLIEKTALMEE